MMRLILLSMKYLKMNIKSIKKNKTMKIINLLIIQWIAVTSAKLTFLWVIIEFILYLVKDKPFNWLSIWLLSLSMLIILISILFTAITKFKMSNKSIKPNHNTNGKFQERLNEMTEQRKKFNKI